MRQALILKSCVLQIGAGPALASQGSRTHLRQQPPSSLQSSGMAAQDAAPAEA